MKKVTQVTTEKVVGQPFRYTSTGRQHTWSADAPLPKGGDTAPTPVENLLGSLGQCIAMTIEGAAASRGWPVPVIRVSVTLDETDDTEQAGKKVPLFDEHIELEGDLDDNQLTRLKGAAQACTVYKLMTGKKVFRSNFTLKKPAVASAAESPLDASGVDAAEQPAAASEKDVAAADTTAVTAVKPAAGADKTTGGDSNDATVLGGESCGT